MTANENAINKDFISLDILDFLTGIHGKKDAENLAKDEDRRQKIFDRAFYNAYGDMSTHTVKYTSDEEIKKYFEEEHIICRYNKRAVKEAIKQYIQKDFEELKKTEDFSKWHSDVCKKIAEDIREKKIKVKNLIDPKQQTYRDCFNKNKNKDISCPNEVQYMQKVIEKHGSEFEYAKQPISSILQHKDIENTVFSYGQAQKLVNMMVKYLYIYCNCYRIHDLNSIKENFHCPIDSYVLDEVYKKHYKGTPWSQIVLYGKEDDSDENSYMQIQNKIKEYANGKGYNSSFEWELAGWPFQQ